MSAYGTKRTIQETGSGDNDVVAHQVVSAVWEDIMTSGGKSAPRMAKAVKSAAAEWKRGEQAPVMYRTNLRDVPKVDGLKRDDGWVDVQVQFLIDKKSAGANHVVGWTVLKPGARHVNHRQHNCDEFSSCSKARA